MGLGKNGGKIVDGQLKRTEQDKESKLNNPKMGRQTPGTPNGIKTGIHRAKQ